MLPLTSYFFTNIFLLQSKEILNDVNILVKIFVAIWKQFIKKNKKNKRVGSNLGCRAPYIYI